MTKDKKKYLMMDLDNTIIETKSGETFSQGPLDWKFKDDVLMKIASFYSKGYTLWIVTNQGGIDKGYYLPTQFQNKLSSILNEISCYLLCI